MKYVKYTFECLVTGLLVAIVVHGMVVLGAWLTLGLWLNEGGQYWYAFIASVAMFACLYALFESVILKITSKRWYQYKVAPYALITILGIFPALVWSVYEFNHSGSLKLTVIEDRQPLFTIESDGAVQNEYQLDIVNEATQDMHVLFSTASDLQGLMIAGTETPLLVHHGEVNSYTIFIKLPEKYITHKTTDIDFIVKNIADATMQAKYKTTFNEPEADSNNQ